MSKTRPRPSATGRIRREENRLLGAPFQTREEFRERTIPPTVYSPSSEWNPLMDQCPEAALAIRKSARGWYEKSKRGIRPFYDDPSYDKKEQSSRFYGIVPKVINGRRPALYFVKRHTTAGTVILEAVDPLIYYKFNDLRQLLMDDEVEDINSLMRGIDLRYIAIGDLIWVNK